MLLRGLRYKEQDFQPTVARLNASAMNLAVIAIVNCKANATLLASRNYAEPLRC